MGNVGLGKSQRMHINRASGWMQQLRHQLVAKRKLGSLIAGIESQAGKQPTPAASHRLVVEAGQEQTAWVWIPCPRLPLGLGIGTSALTSEDLCVRISVEKCKWYDSLCHLFLQDFLLCFGFFGGKENCLVPPALLFHPISPYFYRGEKWLNFSEKKALKYCSLGMVQIIPDI